MAETVDLTEKFKDLNKRFDDIVVRAAAKAYAAKLQYVYMEAFLWSFLEDPNVIALFKKHGIEYDDLLNETIEVVVTELPKIEGERETKEIETSPHLNFLKAYYSTLCISNYEMIDNEVNLFIFNVLIAMIIMLPETYSSELLITNGFNQAMLAEIFEEIRTKTSVDKGEDKDEEPEGAVDKILRKMTGKDDEKDKDKDILKVFCTNLTERVKEDSWVPLVGRELEIELLQEVLLRHDKPNIMVVGNTGCGKTKLIEGLAKEFSWKSSGTTFYQLNNIAVITNLYLKGELEERLKKIFDCLKDRDTILFIDDVHTLCNSDDNTNNVNLASTLKQLIESTHVKVIGTTTYENYRKTIEKDTNLTKKFFRLNLSEPTREDALNILQHIKGVYEKAFGVTYTKEVIEYLIDRTIKFFSSKSLLSDTIDVLDTAGAVALYKHSETVDEETVNNAISKLLNIPLDNVNQTDEELFKNLEETIKKEIMGQDEAVKKVVEAVVISKSGLREMNKTASNMMFIGESGVGKTELCRVLSKTLGIPLVRFDMSEYMDETSTAKMLGAPPGYKDSGNGKSGNGLLINAIEENPQCVLLLDEIEKANPKVHNLLLQVMDSGQVTSSIGKTVRFENVYLIMTSNVGSYNTNKSHIGFGHSDESIADEDYDKAFLPEFRNRIDTTVKFNSLPKAIMKDICNKFLNELKKMLEEKGIDFCWNDDIVEWVVKNVSEKGNGARPMKNVITSSIKNVIAKDIVYGKYKNGGKIELTVENNEIKFGGE